MSNLRLSSELLDNGVSLKAYDTLNNETTLVLGTLLSRDNSALAQRLSQSSPLIYLSAMEDPILHEKATLFSKCEVGSEEGVFGVLIAAVIEGKDVPNAIKEYLEDLDEGYLSAECNVGEEEAEEIAALLKDTRCTCILSPDLEYHPKAKNLAKLIALFASLTPIDVVMVGQEAQEAQDKETVIPEEIEELASFDGTVVYHCPVIDTEEETMLFGSAQFGVAAKAKDGQRVLVQTQTNRYERTFKVDTNLKGTVALLPVTEDVTAYRYGQSKITQVG